LFPNLKLSTQNSTFFRKATPKTIVIIWIEKHSKTKRPGQYPGRKDQYFWKL